MRWPDWLWRGGRQRDRDFKEAIERGRQRVRRAEETHDEQEGRIRALRLRLELLYRQLEAED